MKLCSSGKTVEIGNDVWIGDDVTILGGVTIGDGAVVGTSALVTKDVPPYSIVGGVPAKVIRMRFEQETINRLLDIKWWNWDISKIKQESCEFDDVEKFINNRLDLEHLNKINEKLNETQASANAEANKMRYRLFEERWKNGFYTDGKHMPVPGKEDDGEVKALKEEVKSLKGDINELKQLLIDKLK